MQQQWQPLAVGIDLLEFGVGTDYITKLSATERKFSGSQHHGIGIQYANRSSMSPIFVCMCIATESSISFHTVTKH